MAGEKQSMIGRRGVLAAGVSAGVGALAGCLAPGGQVTEESERTFAIPEDTPLAVENRNGDVRVERGESSDVVVEVVERTRFDAGLFDGVDVEGTTDEGVFTVATTYDRDRLASRVSVELTVRLPETNALSSASTQNGDTVVEGVTGDATVGTVNGHAEARDVAGYVTMHSSNGDTVARGTTGIDGAATTNGEVDVEVLDIRDETVLRSTNGDVAALLASDLEATLDAQTVNGEVEAKGFELGDRRQTARRLSGDLNGGGPTLRLRTTNGDVDLTGR